MKTQSILAGVLLAFSASSASAAVMMDYVFSYSAPGGALVDGTLQADGVDAGGFLTGVSSVRISVGATFSTQRSPMLDVLSVSSYLNYNQPPKIPANGSLENISLSFRPGTWNFGAVYLHLHEITGFQFPLPYVEAELVWVETPFPPSPSGDVFLHTHEMEYYGTAANWTLTQVSPPSPPSVPEGGATLAMMGIGLAGLVSLRRLVFRGH